MRKILISMTAVKNSTSVQNIIMSIATVKNSIERVLKSKSLYEDEDNECEERVLQSKSQERMRQSKSLYEDKNIQACERVLEYGIIPIMVFIIYKVVDSTQSVQLINMLINKIKIFQNWNYEKDYL